jgi:probable F420-dependent oxidoreductase
MGTRPFRFGVVAAQVRSAEQWVAKARRIEELGYSTLVMPDTLGPTLPPLTALAAAATVTSRLRLGTYVLANDFRHPVQVARETAALDLLSDGRFELGLGVGRPSAEDDYRALGMAFEPGSVRVDRLEEALGIIDALFRDGHASVEGRHYRVQDAALFPPPVQRPRPPLLIAASGPRLLALAGRRADAVALGVPPTATEVGDRVEVILRAAGQRADQVELNLNLAIVVPSLQAAEAMPPQMAAYLGTSPADLVRGGSISMLVGDPQDMADRLLDRRDKLGISYYAVSEFFMEALAPVVERLTGR